MKNLNVKNLLSALSSLKIAWAEYQKDCRNDFVKDAVIHRFENAYALAIKYIQRYLELTYAIPGQIDHLTFNELIRLANEKGILQNDLSHWATYRQRRNITSHTYNVQKAELVLEIIDEFIEETQFLAEKIQCSAE